jgi:hydroxymethylpyrimidine pyrophosphatase-like HAD family hydrolase
MTTDPEQAKGNVVLFDLDGTLIDGSYKPTDDRIYSAVAEAQAIGWKLGPHSDTPYEALHVWKERFGMNGPTIAEKGAVVEIDGRPDVDAVVVEAFAEARQRTTALFEAMDLRVWTGNPVEALRDGLKIGEVDERVILMNGLSQASLRFFVRRVNDRGELEINRDDTAALVARAREVYPAFDDLGEDLNHKYGLVIASLTRYTKRNGALRLMAARGLQQVVMVGNTMDDYLNGGATDKDIAYHGAVGNADPAFWLAADYGASREPEGHTTGGAVEILHYLTTGPGRQLLRA